ncbi:MAG TPA: hypothetical protein VFK05_24600 [Polyangiaceae bacterium]|nr:hypothetical protein [Polyangiaceae bacterium]
MAAGLTFAAFVLSCAEREQVLAATLSSLRASGWHDPACVVMDDGRGTTRLDRIHRTWLAVLRQAGASRASFTLLLEDDIVFGHSFRENLMSWALLRAVPPSRAFYASLYNPGRPSLVRRPEQRYFVAESRLVWGAQALVLTPEMARFIAANWGSADGNPDMRMPQIAARVTPIYYHLPSLVDHAPVPTTWGGMTHSAIDFDPDWRASQA